MRIGINALYLLPGKVGGTEIFIRNLVRSIAEVDSSNEYFIFINRESRGVFDGTGPNFTVVECPINATSRPVRILWEQLVLPFQLKRRRIDVLYNAGMTAPFICPSVSLVVIYDLQHVNQPQNFPRYYLFFLRSIIYLSARTSEGIITISNHVKDDIVKHYRIPPEKVFVTYSAADLSSFCPRDEEEVGRVREKYELPDRFVLYIASSLPHKNYRRLIEAFAELNRRDKGLKLVLIGARDYGAEVIRGTIKEMGLEKEVVFLGWLPFEDLPPIYCASSVFVFPSLHEGFGIPIIEAMACGVPVVCSGIEPLIEVAGGAAHHVDPESVESIAEGIRAVLEDSSLRDDLVAKGIERAKIFSWKAAAEETLKVMGSAAAGRKAGR